MCAFANTATTCPPMMFSITSPFNFYDSMMCARGCVCASCASSEERSKTLGV